MDYFGQGHAESPSGSHLGLVAHNFLKSCKAVEFEVV